MDEKIKLLQDNLLIIRRIAGLSAESLGDMIGVSRQTINNLESKKCKLNKTQYIAIIAVLHEMINEDPTENYMLGIYLEAIVENPEKYSDEDRKAVYQKAKLLSPAVISGISTKEETAAEFIAILGVGFLSAFIGKKLIASDLNSQKFYKDLVRSITNHDYFKEFYKFAKKGIKK